MTTYGYARVSTRDQNINRQIDALEAFPIVEDCIFVDYYSGTSFERPSYLRLVGSLASGDLLVVTSIDRLGRNYEEIIFQWHHLTHDLGTDIVVLDMPLLDTRSGSGEGITGRFVSDLVLQVLSYVAQIERENIHRRQAEGIAAAKARGKKFGRPSKPRPKNYPRVAASYLEGKMSKTCAAQTLKVSRGTFDKWLNQDMHNIKIAGTSK